jgi:hypothetical protein
MAIQLLDEDEQVHVVGTPAFDPEPCLGIADTIVVSRSNRIAKGTRHGSFSAEYPTSTPATGGSRSSVREDPSR